MVSPPTVDAPDAAATLGRHLYDFDSTTGKKGAVYYRDGHVEDLRSEDGQFVLAQVRGQDLYEVEWEREGDTWLNSCTCPMGEHCKHAFAVALAWLARLGRDQSGTSGASRGAPNSKALPAKPTAVASRPTFRGEYEKILAAKIGRDLTPQEGAFLGTLSGIHHNFVHCGWLSGQEIRRLGFDTRESRRSGFQRPYDGWWEKPPGDPLALWQIFAHDIETSGLEVPAFMRPVTDTAPVREFVQGRQRREAIARWTQHFEHLSNQARVAALQRHDKEDAIRPLELRLRIDDDAWCLETRANADVPWKTVSHSFLDQLLRDGTTGLTRLEAAPAVYAFLALCQEYRQVHYRIDLRPANPSALPLLHRLLAHRLARMLVVDTSGQPLTFSPVKLVWRLTPAEQTTRDYELELRFPDGTPLPAGTLHLPGQPDYYLHRGVVYCGAPAVDGVAATTARVPAEAVERPEVLQLLREFGAQLPREFEERFVTVALRARIECALAFDHSGSELLSLQLFAVADQPSVKRAWAPHGWQDSTPARAKESNPPDHKIVAFDFAVANAAAAELHELKLSYDGFNRRWTRRVTRAFPEEFVTWRAALPPEVEVLASGELASLLGAPIRASVDFSLIESSAHRDWFDLALALKPEDTTLTPEELALLLKARGQLVRIPGKGWRRLTVQLGGAPAAALEAAGFNADSIAEAALAGEKHRFHALQLANSAVADLLPERQANLLRARARAIACPEPPAIPAGLRAELRPYQVEGFHFLAFLSANQLGGVLADDMGLGKTVQTLAWLLWLAEKQAPDQPLRVLVVCPKSVVGNWETETARFAPPLQTTRFTPALVDSPAPEAGHRLVLANYTQLRLAAEYFSRQRWHAVILDEGQFIKTPTSKVAQVARELPAEHRLILSGTPIENRLLDLWSLFAFSLPGLLGTQAAFKRQYADDNPLALPRLRTRVRHFLLRRTKSQVAADLPPRTEEDVLVDLEGDQRKLYDAELKRARAELLKVKTAREFDQARFNLLASLLRLRQICCHPALIDAAHSAAPSAKLEELLERLEALRAEGHQVLVFSQFVTMLELIREKLTSAGIDHLMLTGQTEDRDTLVRQFQTEKKHSVFLLSLKAAGFGLNLTAASYVILYDPWWNPAVEAQAIDRTHRIGQLVPVNAYRFIARGTVEEKIRALQKEKSTLAGAVVQEESLASVLDIESLRQILS